ncbi:HlyD family efflux transporter periplasmic adaptor subunit [Shewanella sp. JM162201]|uniref:HlyD family efflux transporter periplasmic adaptor subunit n=1 Tax=Shewanella jiangmenensis TaxID=2837387 RepID=A0ABS5V873_9GAMM|nr:HlyD family efflux transporter periplasmic adaptor subunit [Shewanella jiangmenensis]MBT1446640.1 HlyD family efflux transporter periplasmic adaptor subunit [Shewanella jiangmenensis]
MDITISKRKNRWRTPALVVAIATVLGVAAIQIISPAAEHRVERNQLLIGTVKRGDLQVSVDGYGVLRSNKQRLISAESPATVADILLRPGAEVTPDAVILQLQDPQLQQELEQAAMMVSRQQAAQKRGQLANQREMLAEEVVLAELVAQRDTQLLRLVASRELAERGVVAAIEFKTAELQERQLSQRIALQKQRLAQLKEVAAEDLNIANEELKQAKASLQRLEQRVNQLTVRAGIHGVLQRLPVELGQSVTAGQELALIGSSQDLQALIRVSQSKVEQLRVGQSAVVNTRRETARAEVSRITPQVQDGTVEVELRFVDTIPASARPELNVDAQIFTADLKNVLYLERPVNVQSHASSKLFRYHQDEQQLQATALQFSDEAGRYLVLQTGANEGEAFVLSDMATFADANTISVNH